MSGPSPTAQPASGAPADAPPLPAPAPGAPSPRVPRSRALSRRQALQAGAAAGLGLIVSSLAPAAPRRHNPADLAPLLPRVREMRNTLQAIVRGWAMKVSEASLARAADKPEDRFTYTVDVGQLMWFFALARDRDPYIALADFAKKNLIRDRADDPYTRGFVLWRHFPNQKPDASGTTEALRIARALWTGATAFDRKEDAALAETIFDGYTRHAAVDQGVWLIRNYFNIGSRSFATNSFIIDYDADFAQELADAHKNDADPGRYKLYKDIADRSYDVMNKAIAPCGLLYDVVQPELKTMYYQLDVTFFSPNDIIQTSNACTTAATCAKGAPNVARGVLSFMMDRITDPRVYYYGRTGEPVRGRPIGAPEYSALVRLAANLSDKAALAQLTEQAFPYWEHVVSKPTADDAWMASEVLLGLQAVLDYRG